MDRLKGRMQAFMMDDVEMGKKDDDFKTASRSGGSTVAGSSSTSSSKRQPPSSWRPSRVHAPSKRHARRFVLIVLALGLLYLFVKNIPKNEFRRKGRPIFDEGSMDGSRGTGGWGQVPPRHKSEFDAFREKQNANRGGGVADGGQGTGGGEGEGAAVQEEEPWQVYDGPVNLPSLTATLQNVERIRGGPNKHVLFAASSLKTASEMLPLACVMGRQERSTVHFALMSMSDIDIQELLKVNGISERSCQFTVHDARVDYPMSSSESRLRQGISDALITFNIHMRPTAVMVDGSHTIEDPYFLDAMQHSAGELQLNLIELPNNPIESVGWMAKLDSSSLSVWNDVQISIIITATSGTPGSLIRLLQSLDRADYSGLPQLPHLTIELPPTLDDATSQFLERKFRWPPSHWRHQLGGHGPPQFSVRKRIPPRGLDEDEASTRFLESFWPAGNPQTSHVLLLSPNVEVEPNFLHFLRYTVLEYRHSLVTGAVAEGYRGKVAAISLEMPRTAMDGATELVVPSSEKGGFLYQGVGGDAIFVTGSVWIEFHELVQKTLGVLRGGVEEGGMTEEAKEFLERKVVGRNRPNWTEHFLRLLGLRGYVVLHPGAASVGALVTVHEEHVLGPEEYEGAEDEAGDGGSAKGGPFDGEVSDDVEEAAIGDDSSVGGEADGVSIGVDGDDGEDEGDGEDGTSPYNDVAGKGQVPLLDLLPRSGMLTELTQMAVLGQDGKKLSGLGEVTKRMGPYREWWRREVGGCFGEEAVVGVVGEPRMASMSVGALFCYGG